MSLIVAVTGGRDYSDVDHVYRVLDEVDPGIVIQGGATGADRMARNWAILRKRQCVTWHYVDAGKAGGPIRNRNMMESGNAALLIAFPGGRGTHDCIGAAYRFGVQLRDERTGGQG